MSEQRWIMVADGTPQIFYVGQTDLTDSDIEEAIARGGIIVLKEARAMRTIVLPTPQGVNQSNMLTPVSICRAGATLRIRPTAWFWPDEDKEGMDALNKQLESCGYAELKHRAEKSGIELPGRGGVNADGLKI